MKLKISILSLLLVFSILSLYSQTEIIAHRGYWKTEGSAQNSISSLIKADSIGVYGSELDIWLSSDGIPVVNHDAEVYLNGEKIVIQDSHSSTIRKVTLSNGENIPTLEEYLDAYADCTHTKLIIEFKTHKSAAQERELAQKTVRMINERGLSDRVEYIAFGINFINLINELAPDSPKYYLNGDLTPRAIKALNASGIDYNYGVIDKYPEWVEEAHSLGLKVNVWTVNAEDQITKMLKLGVDYITTDEPELVRNIINNLK